MEKYDIIKMIEQRIVALKTKPYDPRNSTRFDRDFIRAQTLTELLSDILMEDVAATEVRIAQRIAKLSR